MPTDPETQAVSKDTVLEVLTCHDAPVSDDPDFAGHTLIGDDSIKLSDWVEKDVLRRFCRAFSIPLPHFYHPQWAKAAAKVRAERNTKKADEQAESTSA